MTNNATTLLQRIEALQERISSLCDAILRISASLDLDTVLQEIVDSARALTGAAKGGITTIDERGRPRRFLTSCVTREELRRPRGLGPTGTSCSRSCSRTSRRNTCALSIPDLPAYLRSNGFSSGPMPYRALHEHALSVTGACTWVSCSSARKRTDGSTRRRMKRCWRSSPRRQATAIANARAYRDEQRARASLEALVDTSPFGVAVFNAATGDFLSINREAKRIIRSLRTPGHPIEEAMQHMTARLADGREVSLCGAFADARAEHSQDRPQRGGRALRSRRPQRQDARKRHADPCAPEGGVDSVVVTMQDLAPFEELERIRTEFLAIVSHELRAPLTSIKGSTATVLSASPGFVPVRNAAVFPHHRLAGGSHERPDRRPPGCGTHRDGDTVGLAATIGCGGRWWTGPGTCSSEAAAGTRCSSTFPRTFPA